LKDVKTIDISFSHQLSVKNTNPDKQVVKDHRSCLDHQRVEVDTNTRRIDWRCSRLLRNRRGEVFVL